MRRTPSPAEDELLFGRWLKKRRRSLGLTQKAVAARADASEAMVRKIEAEERRPSLELARRLAELLDVPPEEHEAFLKFARGGWSDVPPAATLPDLDRPWLLRSARLPTPEAPTTGRPTTTPPPDLVARAPELQRLDSHLARALSGQPQVVLVHGEPGQGKTTLLRSFAHTARQDHPTLLVASGSCNAYTGPGDPYLPFREILHSLIDDDGVVAIIDEAGPDLIGAFLSERPRREVLAAEGRDGRPPAGEIASSASGHARDRGPVLSAALMAQYLAVVARLAKERPLLLILDDLHWIDAASADLLLHLAKHLSRGPVLLLGAYRGVEVAQGRGDARHPLATVVNELRREYGDVVLDLDRGSDRDFVDAWLDREPNQLDEGFRLALARQTGGHPLFTIELVHAMQERGDLVRDANSHWTAPRELSWTSLPARVEGVIDERLGRLAPRLTEWLRVAAVEGDTFTADVIAHVLGVPLREIARGLSAELGGTHQLVAAHEVRRIDGVGIARFRFRHHLIQRRLYEALDTVERVYFHEQVAEALATLHANRVNEVAIELARHFLAAGAPSRAVAHLRQAARNARRAGALDEAIRYFAAALDPVPDPGVGLAPSPAASHVGLVDDARMVRERAELEHELAECQWLSGRHAEAQATLAQAFTRYESIGDADGAGAVQRRMGRVSWEMGMRAESLEHYRRSLAILQDRPANRELAWTLSSMAQMHMLASEYDLAVSSGERALELARRLDAKDVIAHALNNIGTALLQGWPERSDEGEAKLVESKELALELGLAHDAARAMYNLAEALQARGRTSDSRHALHELLSHADRYGLAGFIRAARYELFDLDRRCGRWREAFANPSWIERETIGPASNYRVGMLATVSFAAAQTDQGSPDIALAILDAADDAITQHGELQSTLPYLGERIRALAAVSRTIDVEHHVALLLQALATATYTEHGAVRGLLAACRWLGTGGEPRLREQHRSCVNELQRLERQYASPTMTAALREGEGWLALHEDDAPRAAERLEDADRRWLDQGFPLDRIRALEGAREALQRAGHTQEAARTLETASAIVTALNAQLSG